MKLINYFLDNIDKYYQFLSNDLITSISKNDLQDIPNINLYGINACMKNHYVYYIINQLTKSKFNHRLLKTQKYNINVNMDNHINILKNKKKYKLNVLSPKLY